MSNTYAFTRAILQLLLGIFILATSTTADAESLSDRLGHAAYFAASTRNAGSNMAAAKLVKNDTLSVPPFFAVPSLETTPVEMEMRGIRWRVPRNFLESADFSDRSEDPARRLKSINLRIVTTLSTLHGATAETLPCYKALRVEVCPDTIIMLTQWGEVSSIIRNGPAIAEAARDPRDDLFGLTKVNTRMGLGPGEVYVFYGGSPEASIVVSCITTDRELLQDCTVRYDADGVPMRYSFGKRQLRHWRRIHDGVVAIIKSFNLGEAK